MKIKSIAIEDLQLMSYADMAYMILKEANKPINTPNIFKEICALLGYNDNQFADKIGDFYTSLTLDKRFVLLENALWDRRDNHSVELILDDEEEVLEEEIEDEEILEEEVEHEDLIHDEDEEDDFDSLIEDDIEVEDEEDELEDLSIVSEEEIE